MNTSLGKRALLAGFEWRAGCRGYCTDFRKYYRIVAEGPIECAVRERGRKVLTVTTGDELSESAAAALFDRPRRLVPDFRDACTFGCLLDQVQQLDDSLRFPCRFVDGGWSFAFHGHLIAGATPAEALVKCLEAVKAAENNNAT